MAGERRGLLYYILNEILDRDAEIVSLIFDNDAEFEMKDAKKIERYLKPFVKNKGFKNLGVILIRGVGGDTTAGMKIAIELRKIFNGGLIVVVPECLGSCMVYPVFSSSTLLMKNDAYLTPIDPIFRSMGGMFRATKNLNSKRPKIQKKSEAILLKSLNFCVTLLDQHGSIIFDPGRLNLNNKVAIIELFFKSPHGLHITYDMIKKLKFGVFKYDEGEIMSHLIKTYIELVDAELRTRNKRGVFEIRKKTLWL